MQTLQRGERTPPELVLCGLDQPGWPKPADGEPGTPDGSKEIAAHRRGGPQGENGCPPKRLTRKNLSDQGGRRKRPPRAIHPGNMHTCSNVIGAHMREPPRRNAYNTYTPVIKKSHHKWPLEPRGQGQKLSGSPCNASSVTLEPFLVCVVPVHPLY